MEKSIQTGHAWNLVIIDGESFYADVTVDSDIIKLNLPFKYIQSQDEIEKHGLAVYLAPPYKVEGLSKEKKEELVAYQFELAHKNQTSILKKRPTELPYSKNRIAEGVSRASQIANNLLIEANSREEDNHGIEK